MDAFEQIVADLLRAEGWWVTTNFTIQLNQEQRALFGMKYARPFEFDIVAYCARTNTLRVMECRSYMFSKGVQAQEVRGEGGAYKRRYRLFHNTDLQKALMARLVAHCVEAGLCQNAPTVELGLVCGKVSSEDGRQELRQYFHQNGWKLWDDHDLRAKLLARARNGYANNTSVLVAKLFDTNP